MNYLDLLRTVKERNSILENIQLFESESGISLPGLFRNLVSIYDLSTIGKAELLSFYDANYKVKLQLYSIRYMDDENISIEQWYDLNEILPKMEAIYRSDFGEILKNYLTIGESFDQGMLLLGVGEENRDQIFIEYAYPVSRIRKIKDNIFDFLLGFEIQPMETYLPSDRKLNDLYKNWGEDFWRIRGEKEQ